MNEKLLLKCRNAIVANEITDLLRDHNIAYRQHDESQDQANGAYGAITGIAIYVFEGDYCRAMTIVQPTINELDAPAETSARHRIISDILTNIISIVSLLFILISGGYFVYLHMFKFESTTTANCIALTILFIGIALPFILKYTTNRKSKR